MSKLKSESLNKCIEILRECIDEEMHGGKKGIAVLALNQLQTITAGDGPGGETGPGNDCNGTPRVD